MASATFIVSGAVIVLLLIAKKLSMSKGEQVFVLKIIAKTDKLTREIYHRMVHYYSEIREGTIHFLDKKAGMYLRNLYNKLVSYVDEKRDLYTYNMRNTKLLKGSHSDISEFLKNVSDVEKGNGKIEEIMHDSRSSEENVSQKEDKKVE